MLCFYRIAPPRVTKRQDVTLFGAMRLSGSPFRYHFVTG
jgi:hypothetical protein